MAIEVKRRGCELGTIQIDAYKMMTSEGPRKIKARALEILIPSDLDSQKYKTLQITAEESPVKLNPECSVDIKLNWHQAKN